MLEASCVQTCVKEIRMVPQEYLTNHPCLPSGWEGRVISSSFHWTYSNYWRACVVLNPDLILQSIQGSSPLRGCCNICSAAYSAFTLHRHLEIYFFLVHEDTGLYIFPHIYGEAIALYLIHAGVHRGSVWYQSSSTLF